MQEALFLIALGIASVLFLLFIIASIAAIFVFLGAPDDFNDVHIEGTIKRKTND
jgi:hypothetical protein